ncbi:lysine-rich nucleolar protein 1 isoform X2 [Phascolarctos cinereus]|uniref:Lysine-rich nucleolar protein 1 isoform X2 n=1 Tax=Phascolarctos cinereus TaxID=38626 RepID=A0A6P5IFW8_PHACI|nr:lysine-rich nucleolar protein 1 isoform X2 [Phascolarctos cinereus]
MIAKAEKLDFGKETREKKKKKKKEKAVEKDALDVEPLVKTKPSQKSMAPPGVPEMPLLKKKKKKKKKTQEAESPGRALHEGSMEAESMGRSNSLKKHHSRKELLPNPPESPCQGKRKKTKSSLSHPRGAETVVDAELEGDLVRKPKKRKKDKKSDQESFGEQEPKEALPDPVKEEEEKEKECEPIEQGQREEKQDLSSLRDSGTKKKKKKKKKTYREEEKEDEEDCRTDKMPIDDGHIEDPSAFSSCRKKGHKKKQPRIVVESVPLVDSPGNIKKKEKKSKTQIEPPFAEEPAQKKKKTTVGRKMIQDPQGPGMVRRKALQEEIDRESGKTEALETKVEAPTQFGQWDTATFENSDQKMKFLRLMGGFKNSSLSLNSSPGTAGKPNMALNKQAAAALQQNLQVEFDRAMSWKHQRGVGLGYSASANKNKLFYVDRNASRSVKFND